MGKNCKGSPSRENCISYFLLAFRMKEIFLIVFKLQCLNPELTLSKDVSSVLKEGFAKGVILPHLAIFVELNPLALEASDSWIQSIQLWPVLNTRQAPCLVHHPNKHNAFWEKLLQLSEDAGEP